jgi:hypothetical protein
VRSAAETAAAEDVEIVPRPPSVRHKPRKSTDSRTTTPRSTLYESQMPSPAPTTPLPQLPPEARRPPTRENGSQQQQQPQPPPSSLLSSSGRFPVEDSTSSGLQASEHSQMARFMTEKNTMVFRRFDDVHVRLLLCLQDEIAELERDLLKIEAPSASGSAGEKMSQKMRILRDLRKVVAEYGKKGPKQCQAPSTNALDHLFTTWSTMQANKMDESTGKELRRWLETPGTSAQAGLGIDVRQELQWLDNSKDLSSLRLSEKAEPAGRPTEQTQKEGGPSGGVWALFGCAGKRKS